MSRLFKRMSTTVLVSVPFLLLSHVAGAQDWKAQWDAVVAKAKGQTLALAVQQGDAFDAVIQIFQKKFPGINVQTTTSEPSQMAPRIVTEQKNGLYAWDSWWATASNMNAVVVPAGGFEKITDYLILPEVKDPANWEDQRYLYPSAKGPYIFSHTNYLETNAMYDEKKFPGGFTLDKLMDPSLKGKISIRVPNRPHGGSMTLAAIAKEKGADFLRRLMTDMQPVFMDSDRQVTNQVIDGDMAVGIGTTFSDLYTQCLQDGGCKNVKLFPTHFLHSKAVAILKNPPHKEAATVWVNWLLSKEGQEAYVREWPKSGLTGAFSMRKDVKPDPNQLDSVPDYSRLDQYVAVSFDSGMADLTAVAKMYDEVKRH